MPFETIYQLIEFMDIHAEHGRCERQKILFYGKTVKSFNPFYQISRGAGKHCPMLACAAALPVNEARRCSKDAPKVKGGTAFTSRQDLGRLSLPRLGGQ